MTGRVDGFWAATIALSAVVAVPFALVAAIRPLPLDYGGLYALMAELIAQHGPALPMSVPWYGPGGIPFAYPPLGMYVMAALVTLAHVSPLDYLRFAAVPFLALSFPALALLFREITGSASRAVLGVLLALTAPNLLVFQAFAGGAVRGFAYVFTVLGLFFALRALPGGDRRFLFFAGGCFGLTVLSHPANAAFFVVSLAVFALFSSPRPRALVRAGVIAGIGLLVAAPWWVVVVHRYGLGVFGSAFHTHGGIGVIGLGFWNALTIYGPKGVLLWPPLTLAVLGSGFVPVDPHWWPMYGVGFYGFWLLLLRRALLVPVWCVAAEVLISDGERFWTTIVALLAAIALVDIAEASARGLTRRLEHRSSWALVGRAPWLAVGTLAVWSVWSVSGWAIAQRPLLTQSDLRTGQWARGYMEPDATYLALTSTFTAQEWLPWLFRRPPAIAPWGAEWVGRFNQQDTLAAREQTCLKAQSLRCVDRLALTGANRPRYLVIAGLARWPRLASRLRHSKTWRLTYTFGADTVWTRVGHRPANH